MTELIETTNNNGFLAAPQQGGAVAEIAKSRAVQEVQAALIIAKNFPRDQNLAFQRVMQTCSRPSFASIAMYSYKRANTIITGPSIRLAEALAQNYGNLDFGIRELERKDGYSIAESYCWDMETNTRQTKTFEVPHEMQLKDKSMKKLSDPRDIYEIIANNGARRLRQCIIGIIPRDFVDAAVERVRATILAGTDAKMPLPDRARQMSVAFKEHFGVSLEMIEGRLGHKLDLITADEFVELHGIYNALKEKGDKADFFTLESPLKEINKEADVAKETESKNLAVTAFTKKRDELKGIGWDDKQILKTLKVESLNDILLKDSKTIIAALEVLIDASI